MKTFSKLIVAVAALGIATANAQGPSASGGAGIPTSGSRANSNSSTYTPGQAAAIKAVEDAMATGDAAIVAEAMSQAVQSFPEIVTNLVQAAITASPNLALISTVSYSAAFASPTSVSSIKVAINIMKRTITRLVAKTADIAPGETPSSIAERVIQTAVTMAATGASDAIGGDAGEGGDGSTVTPPPVIIEADPVS